MPVSYEKRRTPRYVQLIDYIQKHITSGEWGPHHKVPSEEELSRLFGFARGTVRQAMNELVNANALYRIQGKGTFVGPKLIQHDVNTNGFRSFLDEFVDKRVDFETQQLGCEIVSPFTPVKETMETQGQSGKLLKVRRLRTTCQDPFMYSENHLPYDRFLGIEQHEFTKQGIYETLQEVYGFTFGSVRRYFKAVLAEGMVAKLLKVQYGTPLILTEQIVYDSDGQCIDYAFIWLRSDKVRISVNMDRS